jgi:hypothetical protein
MTRIVIDPLSKDSISAAIKTLNTYKKDFVKKEQEFVRRLAEIGVNTATGIFSIADYDGVKDVTVRMEETANGYAVIADGSTVGFIEFGTGIRHPEHPGFADYQQPAHGTYGKGLGANPGWWDYNGDPGNKGHLITTKSGRTKVRTSGNDPAMAMYEAIISMTEQIATIAREVWSSD